MQTQTSSQRLAASADPIARVPLWPLIPSVLVVAILLELVLAFAPLPTDELKKHVQQLVLLATIIAWWLGDVGHATRRAGFQPPPLRQLLKPCLLVALSGLMVKLVWILLKLALGIGRAGFVEPATVVPSDPTPLALALTLASLVLVGPVAEEMLFRGSLFRKGRLRFGPGATALATSLAFGLLHASIITATLSALAFTVLYTTTRNIWAPILAHALGNLCVFTFANTARYLPSSVLEALTTRPIQLAMLFPGLLGSAWLLRFLYLNWHTLDAPVDGVPEPPNPRPITQPTPAPPALPSKA